MDRLEVSVATPNGTQVFARAVDGSEIDITAGVQAMYDLVLGSMDWGSGFLTDDDAAPMSVVGHACGFAEVDRVDEYIADKRHDADRVSWMKANDPQGRIVYSTPGTRGWEARPHEHIRSSVGRCMWPQCPEGRAK